MRLSFWKTRFDVANHVAIVNVMQIDKKQISCCEKISESAAILLYCENSQTRQ